jgi:hypothetical protein
MYSKLCPPSSSPPALSFFSKFPPDALHNSDEQLTQLFFRILQSGHLTSSAEDPEHLPHHDCFLVYLGNWVESPVLYLSLVPYRSGE